MKNRQPSLHSSGGFTLIEVLAVIVILGILMTLLVTSLGGNDDAVRAKMTRVRLAEIGTVCEAYERRFGDFPASSFGSDAGQLPNSTNVGGEALVAALWSNGYEAGGSLKSEDLVNSDEDRTLKSLTDFPGGDLLELADGWDQPIAYLRSDDYGVEHVYLLGPGGLDVYESRVRASRDGTAGRYRGHGRFQIHSAGADGDFGTEDDLIHP